MKQRLNIVTLLAVLFLAVTALGVFAANSPAAPDTLNTGASSTFNEGNYAPRSHDAIAGNITALTMHAVVQTKAWQGYYGNVTATITLDDANNFTFYNWSAAEPRGQVYATLASSISWLRVECFDFSGDTMDWNIVESFYNIDVDDTDGVNETYTSTGHPAFEVAQRTQNGCPTSYAFRDGAGQATDFVNVLLHDTSDNTSGWIYTTLLENDTIGASQNDLTCYNGQPCDFQLLVNEDGHGTDTSTTTYYFWVELE